MQPVLPSPTLLVIVVESGEKTDPGLMHLWSGKNETFNASYVNCHLTGLIYPTPFKKKKKSEARSTT